MKKTLFLLLLTILTFQFSSAQTEKSYKPRIQFGDCILKADSSLQTKCGYLIVPENRQKSANKTIKLPFIYLASNNPNKQKDVVLFTTGGPGGSSLNAVESVHFFSFIKDRDFIAFEQRGTKYALPNLDCSEVNDAIKNSYINSSTKTEAINQAVKKCRNRLIKQGIDLSGYNTAESSEDLEDLRKALKIDSLNLIGLSYSGGLMLNVLRKYPQHIRSLILDSPLPMFVNIDEDELANFNEVLHLILAENVELEDKFRQYLLSIQGKKFVTDYFDTDKKKSLKIKYTRNELIDIVRQKIDNENERKEIPQLINNLVSGNHKPYIDKYLADVFSDNSVYSGMRLSVYCSDKMAYANQGIVRQQAKIYPFMSDYPVNDVSLEMCKIWNVPPIKSENKQAFYSNVPILLGAGYFDPATRPIYNDNLHHYFPNSHRLLFMNKTHGVLLSPEGEPFISSFLANPNKQIKSSDKNIVVK